MLTRGRTSRLPGHKEARFLRGRVITPVIAQQPCHSTCLVLGYSSRAGGGNPPPDPPIEHRLFAHSQYLSDAWTQQPCRGGVTPPGPPPSSTPPRAGSQRPPHRAPIVCLVTVPVWCLDTAAVPGGVNPPPDPPPRARPLVLGPRYIYLFLEMSKRLGGIKRLQIQNLFMAFKQVPRCR